MVQSDVPRGTTKSGKVNARWYLQRLRASAASRQNHLKAPNDTDYKSNKSQKNDTIRVVRGTTATQGQRFPGVLLKSSTKSFDSESIKQRSSHYRRSGSIHITSATSLKSTSTITKINCSLNDFNSNSNENHQASSLATNDRSDKDEKEFFSDRRSSTGTILSGKADIIPRPPSTPVDPRCHRAYSSKTNPIDREMCILLGPQLCSDCIEVQTRTNLSAERLPANLIHQRLTALALRRFIKNEESLTDDDLLHMVNNQKVQMNTKCSTSSDFNSSIMSDDAYFDRLSSAIKENAGETPYYYKDYEDFREKFRTNKYGHVLISETPAPTSANPIFKESSFEKFQVSPKYSFMKRASTEKPNLKTNASIFISPKKSEQFYNEHRYLVNYSPPLLLQKLQETTRKNSNSHFINLPLSKSLASFNPNHLQKRSLIASRSSNRKNLNQ